ncbi:MAG: molybdenum cofactor guanylyltransferase MobA [Candidatus Nitrotoga sp.]
MNSPAITTVILAGGTATRMGGDKGLQLLHGRPLIDWVLDKMRPHSAEILLNVNTDNTNYLREGCRTIKDIKSKDMKNNVGPLAGLQSALHHARHEWLASVPCDTPFLPDDLLPRLFAALQNKHAEVAVAVEGGQQHPTIALYKKSVSPELDIFLNSGQRKVGEWVNSLRVTEVIFDDARAFLNINSTQDLLQANQKLNLSLLKP